MSSNPGATQSVPEDLGKPLEDSLTHLVDNSVQGSQGDELAPSEKRADMVHAHGDKSKRWISHLWPSAQTLDKLFNYEHMGNYVIDRQTGKKLFESMPLYVRVGMHLLFVNGSGYLSYPSVEKLLTAQSEKQGKMYDQQGPEVRPHIESFIKTYNLPLEELLVTDLDQYPTFNAFFSRRLKPTARPITSPTDPRIVVSPADCRMTCYQTVDKAKQFWIKGKQFTVPHLLGTADPADRQPPATSTPQTEGSQSHATPSELDDALRPVYQDADCAVCIARLAPQDYHRFHSPVEATVVGIKDISGELYTVNPQAINEDLNVFTQNKRSVMLLKAKFGPGRESVPIAFVAVGAMLVGSIGWSKKAGDKVAKGEELGWFQYGGSTCITIFPSASGIQFDEDIRNNSEHKMETLVKVGMEIATILT